MGAQGTMAADVEEPDAARRALCAYHEPQRKQVALTDDTKQLVHSVRNIAGYSRSQRWERSKPLKNEVIDTLTLGNGVTIMVWCWECSQPHCREKYNLRWTPSGVWCERHYKTMPGCLVCGEPVIQDKRWFPEVNELCRNHMWNNWVEIPWRKIWVEITGETA